MELKIEQVAIPEKIAFNYDELKQELSDKVKMYETLVYTDDQIKSAKADRADLNRLKKALNDERIRREKEYMQPFNAFKAEINEIIGIIDKPVALIDKQIKSYEEEQKKQKKDKIIKYFMDNAQELPWLTFEMIFDDKWLNVSVSMKSIEEQIDGTIRSIYSDLATLSNLPEFAFEAIETYKTTLDLNKSIAEGHRLSEIQKRKAEQERIKAEQEKAREEQERLRQEQETLREDSSDSSLEKEVKSHNLTAPDKFDGTIIREWVSFKAFLDIEDAKALAEFFRSRNIRFEKI